MKVVTLTDTYNQTYKDVLLLQNLSDFDEFEQLSRDANEDEIIFALKTDVPESRWDHIFNGGYGCMTTGVQHANVLGGNPIMLSGMYVEQKLSRIRQCIEAGDDVVVNKKGGYFPIYDSLEVEIIEMKEYVQDKAQYVDIPENTKMINLENDLDLEPKSIKYMEARDPNYSSIRKLRLFDMSDLIEIFKKFKENGGEYAYIYTTGTDTEQMYNYVNALVVAGIKLAKFEFNAGIDSKIKNFLELVALLDNIEIEVINQMRD